MADRIYTRSGDEGKTSLADGTRVPKDALRVQAYGDLDEANSRVGSALAFTEDPLLSATLAFLQHRLFNCTACLAVPPGGQLRSPKIAGEDITFLEKAVDRFEEATEKLVAFVLPGGSRVSALLHVARAVCRRAERSIVTLNRAEPVDAEVLGFVNRASDFLFAAARYANRVEGVADVHWDKDMPMPKL